MNENFLKAIQILTSGGVVAIPTETVYGLAGDIFCDFAIRKIFQIKNRPFFDPLIVHIGSMAQLSMLCESISPILNKLVKQFWPGPLTILAKKNKNISNVITADSEFVAIRMPNHPMTMDLLRAIDFPLAAPSANPFGYISPTSAKHVRDQLGDKVDYILDGGVCDVGIESTIISENEKGEIVVHRPGGVSVENLKIVLGDSIRINLTTDNTVFTSGSCLSHYAPRKKLIIGDINYLIQNFSSKYKIGVLAFYKYYSNVPESRQYILSKKKNIDECAKNLFHGLRYLDCLDIEIIIAELLPNESIGFAINDRIKRASCSIDFL